MKLGVLGIRDSYSDVVDPDEISFVESDGITSPNVLGVDVGDGNVPVIGQS